MSESINLPQAGPRTLDAGLLSVGRNSPAALTGIRSAIGILLAGILIAAIGLRLWGISFGRPYRYHPDESQHVVVAARMLAEKSIEPPAFNNPPFYKYVLMGADAAYLAAGLLIGKFDSVGDFVTKISLDPFPLSQLGRMVSALAGTLTVWVTYLIGKRAFGSRVGLIAAAFLAVAFLPVRDAHFATNDSLLTLMVSLSILGSVLVVRRGRTRDYGLAAIAGGLAFATKYTGIFTLAPLILAHFYSPEVDVRSSSRQDYAVYLDRSACGRSQRLSEPPHSCSILQG